MSLRALLTASALFLSSAHAHFSLTTPVSLEGDEMDEKLQTSAPCGGGTTDITKATFFTDFHVDGSPLGWLLGHPQANFLIRATTDEDASKANWTQLFPVVQQSGFGKFCEPVVTAPEEWVGKKGFVGVVANAPDGMLYQCAAVNFVSGAAASIDSEVCTNGTSVSGSFTGDSQLTALVGDGSVSPSPSETASSPAPNQSDSAATSVMGGRLPVGTLAVSVLMVLVGAALA